MKRVLALLMVLVVVLGLLVSCDDSSRRRRSSRYDDDDDDDESYSDEEVAGDANKQTVLAKEKYEFDDYGSDFTDYDGYNFRILTFGSTGGQHWSAYEFYYNEELSGDALNEAVRERDRDLEALHNISVSYVEKGMGGEMTDFVRDTILAGGDEFDLISNNLAGTATLAQEAMLINLRDYDDILNLDGDHWDQKANEQLDINGHLYFTTSDLTLTDKQGTWVIYVTESMLDRYPDLVPAEYDSIYDMVSQGDWTIAQMYNMGKAVSQDDGDGVWTNEDTYGHFGEEFSVGSLMIGCGAAGVTHDSYGDLRYTLEDNVDDLVYSYKLIDEIVHGDMSMTSLEMQQFASDVWVEGAGSLMEKGKVLFNITGMNRCRLFRNLEADFGILPMPKANAWQDGYYMRMSAAANCVAIPITAENKERSCEILETMTYLASKTTYYAYIEQSLKAMYLRDDESEEMLDIIFNSRRFDIGDIYSRGGSRFGAATVMDSIPAVDQVARFIKRRQTANEMTLRFFLEEMQAVFEETARR